MLSLQFSLLFALPSLVVSYSFWEQPSHRYNTNAMEKMRRNPYSANRQIQLV